MRARARFAVALACATTPAWPDVAAACGSCRGPGGAGAALTAPYQRWGTSIAQTTRIGYGVADADARQRPFGAESHDRVLELAVAAAVRPVSPLELGATTAFGHVQVGGPGFRSRRAALGDLALRVRWEPIEEPAVDLPSGSRRPSVGVTFAARLPTGPVDRAGDASSAGPSPGTVGSTATSQGLGTTELALAVDVRKSFATRFQLGVVGEAAYRVPDEALGLSRTLGPRGLARVVALVFLGDVTLALFADVAGEADVAYGGRRSASSAQRLFSVGSSATLKTDTGFRSGIALSAAPPLDGLAKNAVTAATFTTFVAYTR